MMAQTPLGSKSEYSDTTSDTEGSSTLKRVTLSHDTLSSSMTQESLIEIGFWADPRDPADDRPYPSELVDHEWGKTVASRAVALYITSGFLESFELGYSFCRIGRGCPEATSGSTARQLDCAPDARGLQRKRGSIEMGCCTLTDGRYMWPEGLAHYVTFHAVRPPNEFVTHAMRNLDAVRKMQAKGRLRWSPESGGRTMVLEPETAVFLRDRTTLGIALLPESERPHDPSLLCSCVPS